MEDTAKISSVEVVSIDVQSAKGLLQSGHRYLDVRTVEEFEKSHVENAFNVPYMFITGEGKVINQEFSEQVLAICLKEDHLIVGCNSGGRSIRASTELLSAGFKNVKNIEGGYGAWLKSEKSTQEEKLECLWRKK